MSSRVLGIVPARLASTRLPNKPLYPILGRPLIEWVWRRVEGMKVLDEVVVATDAEEVAEVCKAMGAPVEMTSGEHPSGTEDENTATRSQRRSEGIRTQGKYVSIRPLPHLALLHAPADGQKPIYLSTNRRVLTRESPSTRSG